MRQRNIFNCFLLLLIFFGCSKSESQISKTSTPISTNYDPNKPVGGGCDGCELMFIGMPKTMNHIDTSYAWSEKGQKLLITGKVLNIDGKTPAPNVIVYYWQTDQSGYYSQIPGLDPLAKRHGRLRGWVKTNIKGEYAIYTTKPAPYPNDVLPAHIHTAIKELNVGNEYYIDEFTFDEDVLLTSDKRKKLENRGGSGILRTNSFENIQIAEHNIILGLNIPNYPKPNSIGLQSGLNIGEDSPSFIPFHAYGPDQGTRTCPVCKYGEQHGILYFIGNNPNWIDIKKWLVYLEHESLARNKSLKVYFIYGNKNGFNENKRQKELEEIGKSLKLKNIAMTYVPSLEDKESEVNLNKINHDAANTIILYRNRNIVDKFINLPANEFSFQQISKVLNDTKSIYSKLENSKHK